MYFPPGGEYFGPDYHIDTRDGSDVWMTLPVVETPQQEDSSASPIKKIARQMLSKVISR